jgi:hypothetical protein
MRREDWLWVGCKLVGAWLLGISLMQLPMFFAFGERARELVPLSLGMLLPAGFALWLLFGNTLWRLACRPQAHEP